ncbi:MAG: trigger factor [Metamycoplasmataceae bacterium]
MKLKRELNEKKSELEITVIFDKTEWKKQQEKSFNKMLKALSAKGFRKGAVPKEFAIKNKLIVDSDVWYEAIEGLLDKGAKEAFKEIKETDEILSSPTYKVEKVSNEELEIIYVYPIFTDIEIKKYKGLKLPYKLMTEKELKESVEKQVEDYASKSSLWLPKEGKDIKVENGNQIIFDFKGKIDGKYFEGGEAKGFELIIGSKSFIPGFEDKLIGKTIDKDYEIKVNFPKDYHAEELKGKEAIFEIKISTIKFKEQEKVNDEFVKRQNIENVKTVEEFKAYLYDLTKRENEEKTKTKFLDEFMKKVISENKFEVPQTITLKEFQRLIEELDKNIERFGMKRKDYIAMTGKDEKSFQKEMFERAEESVKQFFIFLKVVKDEKIEPKDKDYDDQYELIAKYRGLKTKEEIKKLKEEVKKEELKSRIIDKLFRDFIVKNNQ